MAEVKLFGKWTFNDVVVEDISLADYIGTKPAVHSQYIPHSAKRWNTVRFKKANCPIVERMVCSLMMHGRNAGKKLLAVNILRQAFEIIHVLTGKNPIQVLADAVAKSGPREDSTRIGSGGVVRRQSVDVSPLRRVNQGVYYICCGARESAFRNMKSIAECLADEIIAASQGDTASFAIKRKFETERVAQANR